MSSVDSFGEEKPRLPDAGPVLGSTALPFWSAMILFGAILIVILYKDSLGADGARRILLILLAASIPLLLVLVQLVRLRRAMGTAELLVDSWVTLMGQKQTVIYRRPLRGDASVDKLEVSLECQESVTHGKGRSRRTTTAVVTRRQITPTVLRVPQQLLVQIPLQFDRSGPPSIDIPDHRVEWWLRLSLKMSGCPSTRSSFEIQVPPEYVES